MNRIDTGVRSRTSPLPLAGEADAHRAAGEGSRATASQDRPRPSPLPQTEDRDESATIRNIHQRDFRADAATAGALIDTLASSGDRLWPHRWPRIRFDRSLSVGAIGGHGPIRYSIVAYEPGRSIRFRFSAPHGFIGTHRFHVAPRPDGGARLAHVIEMRVEGPAIFTWPIVFRWLHDALLEDLLDRAAASLGETPRNARWSPWVRFLRWVSS